MNSTWIPKTTVYKFYNVVVGDLDGRRATMGWREGPEPVQKSSINTLKRTISPAYAKKFLPWRGNTTTLGRSDERPIT
jgi:hypothetical protein